MSFSPFEDLLDLAAEFADEPPESPPENRADLSYCDTRTQSDCNDAISLNSDSLQDFGSLISLPSGTLESIIQSYRLGSDGDSERNSAMGGSTILSSAPSGSFIPAPEASQDIWSLSPHPTFVPDSTQALSTICTETMSYQNIPGEVASVYTESSSSSSSENGNDSPPVAAPLVRLPAHERMTFEAIANQLLDNTITPRGVGKWYSRFTDFDWEQLREVARVVLVTNGPSRKPLPLPPSPRQLQKNENNDRSMDREPTYSAGDVVPSNFVCPSCLDVVVGAIALDCGCTLCTTCWEADNLPFEDEARSEGYLWVPRERCTCCHEVVHSAVPCHALDVAVFQIFEDLPSSSTDVKNRHLKSTYYGRLEIWRQIVLARNEDMAKKDALQQDVMLARLIQEEEQVLWKTTCATDRALPKSARTLLIMGQAAVALLAATMASMALKALARR